MITDEYGKFLGWAHEVTESDRRPLWYLALKIHEEAGEVSEAIVGLYGHQGVQKEPCDVHTVVDEMADVICTALIGILRCGADPAVVLRRQMEKVKHRYAE